jgi:hypothetical protein
VKLSVIGLLTLMMAGCVWVQQEAAQIRRRTAEEDAAIRKIRVFVSDRVPGGREYTKLGRVQGYCVADTPLYDTTASGGSLKEAAYKKYGTQVDAIVNVQSWYVPTSDTGTYADDPIDWAGYFECAGDAVTYKKSP